MPRVNCPVCESPIRVTGVTPDSRLACGNCHADLHLTKAGRIAIGDPPDPSESIRRLQREIQYRAKDFPVGPVIFGVVTLLVFIMGLYNLFGPAEKLGPVAEKAAKALAEGDPDTLQSLADPESTNDVQRWYEQVHPRLVKLREEWGGKAEEIGVGVGREDLEQRKGTAGIAIRAVTNGARDVSLADPSNATAAASGTFETTTEWTLTRWGRWKLDGRAIAAKLPPLTASH